MKLAVVGSVLLTSSSSHVLKLRVFAPPPHLSTEFKPFRFSWMVTGTIMFIYYMCVIKVDCKLSVIPKKRLIFFPVIAAVFI